jgi:hypothetical protein
VIAAFACGVLAGAVCVLVVVNVVLGRVARVATPTGSSDGAQPRAAVRRCTGDVEPVGVGVVGAVHRTVPVVGKSTVTRGLEAAQLEPRPDPFDSTHL